MILFYVLIVLIFPIIILGNVLAFHIIIKRAIKKFVDPLLKEKGLSYSGYKWAGFSSHGDFNDGHIGFTTISKTGMNSISVYSFIYYQDKSSDLSKSVTVRIDVSGLSIEKVVYSSEFLSNK